MIILELKLGLKNIFQQENRSNKVHNNKRIRKSSSRARKEQNQDLNAVVEVARMSNDNIYI